VHWSRSRSDSSNLVPSSGESGELPYCAAGFSSRPRRTPADILDYEIIQEQAAALGRMGRALEAALAKLREFDAAHPRAGAPTPAQQARRALVMEAGYALWMYFGIWKGPHL
jgi:hypothetical protein